MPESAPPLTDTLKCRLSGGRTGPSGSTRHSNRAVRPSLSGRSGPRSVPGVRLVRLRRCSVGVGLCLVLLTANGCSDRTIPTLTAAQPAGQPITDPDRPQAAGRVVLAEQTAQTAQTTQPARVLTSLQVLAESLSVAARPDTGLAMVLQPDPSLARAFLVVAPDPVAAQAFNCYFSWYVDWSKPELTLQLDRLFQESERMTAQASGLFSQPAMVDLLQTSLAILDLYRDWAVPTGHEPDGLLDEAARLALTDFILQAYRRDFAERRQTGPPSPEWQETRQFARLEVTYHAGISSYCSFVWLN